ncbi:hypothetical protein YC2023_039762 [Brassica napus]
MGDLPGSPRVAPLFIQGKGLFSLFSLSLAFALRPTSISVLPLVRLCLSPSPEGCFSPYLLFSFLLFSPPLAASDMRVSLGFRASSAEEPRLKLADVLSFRGFSTLGSVLTHVSRLFCPGGDDQRRLFSPFAWCLVVERFLVVLCLVGSVGFFSIGESVSLFGCDVCRLRVYYLLVSLWSWRFPLTLVLFSGSQRLGVSRLSYPVVIWVSRVSYLNPSSQHLKPSA